MDIEKETSVSRLDRFLIASPSKYNKHLYSQGDVEMEGREWHREVVSVINDRVRDDIDFPCVFARNAGKKQLIRFIFVEAINECGIQSLASGLRQYIEMSEKWNGSLDTAFPLIVAFSLNAIHSESLQCYHRFGWAVLQRLHEVDLAPWPKHVAKDPNSKSWSMCFNGMPLFCNMSNPGHIVRRSRNLGRHFMFVINPRERFDDVAGDTPSGRKIRAVIRKRIEIYDTKPHSTQLSSYDNAEGKEWWQYSLIESNSERSDVCPFKFVANNKT